MSRRLQQPSYRLHKPTGLAVVTIGGKDRYLGKHGTPESEAEYKRLIAEWLLRGQVDVQPAETNPDITVAELLVAFLRHAEDYYRGPDGKPTQERQNVIDAIKPLRRLYGPTLAASFRPLALRAVRDDMIGSGLARTTINARINRIRRVFRWAVSVELVPLATVQKLETVEALEKGRSAAPESKGVGPVPDEHIDAALPFMSRPVAAMVQIQRLTACRAGEVMAMRSCDIRTGAAWEYHPAHHKNTWRGQKRVIAIGPKARAIIEGFLRPDLDAFIFSPQDAVAAHHGQRRQARKSKPTPNQLNARVEQPGHRCAARYDRRTYRQAVVRACDKAFPHPTLSKVDRRKLTPDQRAELKSWRIAHRWSPLQLRHAAATTIRAKYGLEAAQNVLGHSKPDTTLIYAERNLAQAHAVAAEIG